MLTASGRKNRVALSLASLAYQIFVQTSAGWPTTDDCNTINTYLIGRGELQDLGLEFTPSTSESGLDECSITNLLIGIHVAAAIEVLRYARRLNIDHTVLRNVVKDAAGSSVIFDRVCEQLHGQPEISMERIENFASIRDNLVSLGRSKNKPMYFRD